VEELRRELQVRCKALCWLLENLRMERRERLEEVERREEQFKYSCSPSRSGRVVKVKYADREWIE
jgi:hypothetical protein